MFFFVWLFYYQIIVCEKQSVIWLYFNQMTPNFSFYLAVFQSSDSEFEFEILLIKKHEN